MMKKALAAALLLLFLTACADSGVNETGGVPSFAENIAEGQKTPEEAVAYWMTSEVHRNSILDPRFKRMGVGNYHIDGDIYGEYWVQEFSD